MPPADLLEATYPTSEQLQRMFGGCNSIPDLVFGALPVPPLTAPLVDEPQAPTDEELLAMRSWSSHGPTFDSDLVDFGRRCYNLAKQPASTPYKLQRSIG